jgi:hypothetical protein
VESTSVTADDEDSQFSGHHHDDVVEHLDVIGMFPPFYVLFPPQFHNNLLQIHKLVPFQISPMPQIPS